MKIHAVCVAKTYIVNGEKKKRWYRVGHVKETDGGGKYLILYQQPNLSYQIFDENDTDKYLE